MSNIPTTTAEMREAAAQVVVKSEIGFKAAQIIVDAIRALPASETPAVRVKPLEWRETADGGMRVADFRVSPSYGQGPERFLVWRGSNIIGWADSAEACRLIAEKNHKVLILSAIEVIPADPLDDPCVKALVDAVMAEGEARTSYKSTDEDRGGASGVKGKAFFKWVDALAAMKTALTALINKEMTK